MCGIIGVKKNTIKIVMVHTHTHMNTRTMSFNHNPYVALGQNGSKSMAIFSLN